LSWTQWITLVVLTRKSGVLDNILNLFNVSRPLHKQKIIAITAPHRTGTTEVDTTDWWTMSHTYGLQSSTVVGGHQHDSGSARSPCWACGRLDGRRRIRRTGRTHVHRAKRRRKNDVPARRRSRDGDALRACMWNGNNNNNYINNTVIVVVVVVR